MNQGSTHIFTGQLVASHTGEFADKKTGEPVQYGKIQLLQKDENGFYRLENVKVRRENFGILEEGKKWQGKAVQVHCEMRQFGKEASFYAHAVKAA